jgi:hypothetical protein
MTVYIVCEDYTCAFYDIYTDKKQAEEAAKHIGGFIEEREVK